MAARKLPDRIFDILPFVYGGIGLLAMLVVQNAMAVLSGLTLIAVGGVELLRRRRQVLGSDETGFRRSSSITSESGGDSNQGLVKITWRKSFDCGHPLIDRQHRQLFEIGDELVNAVLRKKPQAHIEFLLDELVTHIRDHFVSEEAVMARTRFPLSDEHKAIHTTLLVRAQDLRDRYRAGKLMVSELVGFIAYDVVAEHIIKEDLKFALKSVREPAQPTMPMDVTSTI